MSGNGATAVRVHRNEVWEGACLEAPNLVEVSGGLRRPWLTWFVDRGTRVVMGAVVTPGSPSQPALLAVLHACISRSGRFGSAGGLPARVRVGGKGHEDLDLARAVGAALAPFAVEVAALPTHLPYSKSLIETVGAAVERDLFAALPGYPVSSPAAVRTEPALGFAAFTAGVLDWIERWNHDSGAARPDAPTPLEAWAADSAPLIDVPGPDLALFATGKHERMPVIGPTGLVTGGLRYVAAWMAGHVGEQVRVQTLPYRRETIEVFSVETGQHLGPAHADPGPDPAQAMAAGARLRAARAIRSTGGTAQQQPRTREHGHETEPGSGPESADESSS